MAENADFISEHGKLAGKLLEYFGDIEGARTAMEEDYRGKYSSLADFAQELTEETTEIRENLKYYISILSAWGANLRLTTCSLSRRALRKFTYSGGGSSTYCRRKWY